MEHAKRKLQAQAEKQRFEGRVFGKLRTGEKFDAQAFRRELRLRALESREKIERKRWGW